MISIRFVSMKRLDNYLGLIALFCSILLTACTVDNIDNPSVTPEVKPVENDMMDTCVKPGVDFFRYCNGKWIDALTVNLCDARPVEDEEYRGGLSGAATSQYSTDERPAGQNCSRG